MKFFRYQSMLVMTLLFVSLFVQQVTFAQQAPAEKNKTRSQTENRLTIELFRELIASNPQRNFLYSPLHFQHALLKAQSRMPREQAKQIDSLLGDSKSALSKNALQEIEVALKKHHRKAPQNPNKKTTDKTTDKKIISQFLFHGQWAQPFKKGDIQKKLFQKVNQSSTVCEFLVQAAHHYPYQQKQISLTQQDGSKQTVHVQVVEIPYSEHDLSMIIVLPEKNVTPDSFLANIDSHFFTDMTTGLKKQEIYLSIPKFEFHCQTNLRSVLEKRNINFPKKLKLPSLTQITSVRVDESVAVKKTGNNSMPSFLDKVPELIADHPFLYFVRNKKTGAILLLGQMYNPAVEKNIATLKIAGTPSRKKKPSYTGPPFRFKEQKSYLFEMGIQLTAQTGTVRNAAATFPALQNWREQKVELVKETKPRGTKTTLRKFPNQGSLVSCKISSIPAGKTITISRQYKVTRSFVEFLEEKQTLRKPEKVAKPMRIFLQSAPGISLKHKAIKKMAKELYDENDTDWNNTQNFYTWIRKNITYELGVDFRGSIKTIDKKIGDCDDMTALFVAFCRLNGIPARTVWIQDHAYPEFYLENAKGEGFWIPAQVSGAFWFGSMYETRPIFQKADQFRDQLQKRNAHYLPSAAFGYGGKLKIENIQKLIPLKVNASQ